MAHQIIIDPQKDDRQYGVPLVTAETDHLYQQPRPINPLFERILFAVVESSGPLKASQLKIDLGITKEAGRANHDIGVFTGRFDGWDCTINWTTQKKGKIPPGHAVVAFHGVEVGVISPFMDGKPVYEVPSRNEWYGIVVKPHDLNRACAALIAKGSGKDYMWEAFDGPKAEMVAKQ